MYIEGLGSLNFFGVAVFVLAATVLVFVFRAVRAVPQAEEWTVERFGRYTRTLKPGLHILIPFIESIGTRVNMMETVLDVAAQEVITRDNAMVSADAVAFYQIVDAAQSAYEVRDLELALQNLSQTNIRSVIGSMDLDETLSNRDSINARLLVVIDEAAQPWGVKVTRVEIKDLAPPADITEAMGRQMKAERDRRAEILMAEGEKQSAILKAEGVKQSLVLEAEGRREAAFRDAEAREREAEAEAKATAMVSAAISEGNTNAINYFVAQEYVKSLSEMAASPNAKTIFLPLDAVGVAGAVGGVAELTKQLRGET